MARVHLGICCFVGALHTTLCSNLSVSFLTVSLTACSVRFGTRRTTGLLQWVRIFVAH